MCLWGCPTAASPGVFAKYCSPCTAGRSKGCAAEASQPEKLLVKPGALATSSCALTKTIMRKRKLDARLLRNSTMPPAGAMTPGALARCWLDTA